MKSAARGRRRLRAVARRARVESTWNTWTRTNAVGIGEFSQYVDDHNEWMGQMALDLYRMGKVSEENGEMWDAWIMMVGANPRKPAEGRMDKILSEALDVACTGLGIYEHLTGNKGESWAALKQHIKKCADRAGIQ